METSAATRGFSAFRLHRAGFIFCHEKPVLQPPDPTRTTPQPKITIMRFIPTKIHGVLDYVVGLLLIFAPRILGFQNGGPEDRIPVFLGVATLIYSLLTRYELGVFKVIPFKAHLTLDFLSGVFLAISPWAFGFADRVWAPHVLVGLFEIGAAMMTHRLPGETGAVPVTTTRSV
jgi:hypothetical protein